VTDAYPTLKWCIESDSHASRVSSWCHLCCYHFAGKQLPATLYVLKRHAACPMATECGPLYCQLCHTCTCFEFVRVLHTC
jgi:hypothetical protein